MSETQSPDESSTSAARRLVGCAGWSLRKEMADAFPIEGSHLERYAAVLPAVEINSSFYRPHQPQTYARWAAAVPDDFRFSVKLPRAITHDAKLQGVDDALDQFLREAGELGPKLGCVLVQLPPKGAFDPAVAAAFMRQLRGRFGCMLALEGRHPTWFGDDATELMREWDITRVIADPAAGQPGPHVPTTDAAYLRLHGTPDIYYSSYPPDFLRKVAGRLARCQARGADAWCIFDNTAAGAAVPNALAVLHESFEEGAPEAPEPEAGAPADSAG
jgi:uncharacterized protein YecE (DUF72 family)